MRDQDLETLSPSVGLAPMLNKMQATNIIPAESRLPIIAGVEITTDADGRFNLNLLHKASGGEKKSGPAYWLALDSTKNIVNEIERQNTDAGISVSVLKALKGGILQGTFVVEQLAVAYANWISPKFYLQVINTFLDCKKPADLMQSRHQISG